MYYFALLKFTIYGLIVSEQIKLKNKDNIQATLI